MKMKKLIYLAFAAFIMFSVSVSAQGQKAEKKAKGPTVENRVDKVATDLNLSVTEKAAVLALFQKQDVEFKKFKSEVEAESPEFKSKLQELRKTQNEELKAVIGKDKFQALQKIRTEEKAKQAN